MCQSCVLLVIYLLYDGFLCQCVRVGDGGGWLAGMERKKQNGRRAYFLMGLGS